MTLKLSKLHGVSLHWQCTEQFSVWTDSDVPLVRRGIVQCNIQLPSLAPLLLSFSILVTLAISLCTDLKWRGITAISCSVSISTTCIINERRFFMCYGLVSAAWRVWEDRCSYLAVFLLHSLPVAVLLDNTGFFPKRN